MCFMVVFVEVIVTNSSRMHPLARSLNQNFHLNKRYIILNSGIYYYTLYLHITQFEKKNILEKCSLQHI